MHSVSLLVFLVCLRVSHGAPNIVLFLTDDQDVVLGGMTPMVFTQRHLADEGVTFQNAFTSTPICCPSRASLLTGLYAHNHGVRKNSMEANCSSKMWQQGPEQHTFATELHKLNYSTFYAGKYMNQYGKSGDVGHIPPGWCRWLGLVGNSKYYNYTLSVDGIKVMKGDNYPRDYLPSLITRQAIKFIAAADNKTPLLLVLSFPSPHAPRTPAPIFSKKYPFANAPRTPAFNNATSNKHWLVQMNPSRMDKDTVHNVDSAFRDRWRTLMSVDDTVHKVVNALKRTGRLDNTYLVYTSDNGYHMGQFSLPWDKRQPYDTDIRVPLIIRGPGVPKGLIRSEPVLLLDLASTFVEWGGGTFTPTDGASLQPLLQVTNNQQPWRRGFVVEYWGDGGAGSDPECPHQPTVYGCTLDMGCKCRDSLNNTYTCVREITFNSNVIFCQFQDKQLFQEAYNLTEDPYQLTNMISSRRSYNSAHSKSFSHYHTLFNTLQHCRDSECWI